MWRYTSLIGVIAVTAEAAGLGGKPASELTGECGVFALLLITLIALALKGFVRR